VGHNGLEIIRTPFRAPQANGVAERFVRTVRSECLDWLLILNDQHLARVLDVFVEHYNGHRPHRALALTPPCPTRPPVAPATKWGELVSCVAIVSVVWFTDTSWRRDRVSEPYRVPGPSAKCGLSVFAENASQSADRILPWVGRRIVVASIATWSRISIC
jgi:hypothetical protein